jgi:hypothetical protein
MGAPMFTRPSATLGSKITSVVTREAARASLSHFDDETGLFLW